ncbi:MAG TPA: HAD hydrolase-like protein [Anaerolineales bacterium]|nr:HAD hydrolase-like protein [Anaerolineales bacterium]
MDNIVTKIPGLGSLPASSPLISLARCSDNTFEAGHQGVVSILASGDHKVEFINFENHSLAFVRSAMGYPAYYPIYPVCLEKPVRAVLMDLDGTTVRSEEFWIWIIQITVASLLGNPDFRLEEEDLPFVSGHSVSEHLAYCIQKYCPGETVEKARSYYFSHTHRELNEIMQGRGKSGAFKPAPGIKEFLIELKRMGIRIGLVTSGLYEKAWPEILSAFNTMGLGDPCEFYDAIISAGYPLRKGSVGTLGELSPKPHPWLYAETFRVGLGMDFQERHSVVGIEDSGAGICSIRLAGITAIGIAGGNILESGTRFLCNHYCQNFEEILDIIR